MTPPLTPLDQIVPLAERAFPPEADEGDSEEQTVWFNPEEYDLRIELFTETPKPSPGRPPKTYDQRHGTTTRVFRSKQRRAMPATFDRQLQQTQCRHVDCMQQPFDCRSREPGHEKQIVGGLAPQLRNMGTQRVPIREGFITLAPALDDVAAREKAAEEAEFAAWRRGRLESDAQKRAAADREKAAADRADREERDRWQKERETAQAEAAAKVEAKRSRAKKAKSGEQAVDP